MADPKPRYRSGRQCLVVAEVLLALSAASCNDPAPRSGDAGPWPGWRGPAGSGVAAVGVEPPDAWPSGDVGIAWRVEIPGHGLSQPIIAADQIVLTTAVKGPRGAVRSIVALDTDSGQQRWRREVSAGPRERVHVRFGSYATPTPVTDGRNIFAYFGGALAAVDLRGEPLWQVAVDREYVAESRYGAASSPVLTREAVIVFRDDEWGEEEELSWLAAFDRRSGDVVWRSEWRDTCCSYATPLVVDRGSGEEILVASSGLLRAFAAPTGKVLWEIRTPSVQVVPSPVIEGDLLAVTGAVHDRRTAVYRLLGSGRGTRVEELWSNQQSVPEIASPVLHQRILYTVTEAGILCAYDAETGRRHWRRRLAPGPYRASLLAAGGRLYALSSRGVVTVVRLGRTFRLLAESGIEGASDASPAVLPGALLLRGQRFLYRIDASGKEGQVQTSPTLAGVNTVLPG